MTPSTRTRTNSRLCCGVKWMSEAPRSSAFEMARLMKTTEGVSWLRSRTLASSSVSAASVTTSSMATEASSLSFEIASLDRIGRCDADAHRHADREPELVREHHVRRVGDGDEHVAVVEEADRERPVAAGQALGEQQRCRRSRSTAGRARRTRARAARRGHARSPRRRGEALLEQDLAEAQLRPSGAARRARSRAARASRRRRGRGASRGQATGSWASDGFHRSPIGRQASLG